MRRRRAEPHIILPDPKYKSTLLAKFINHLMERGKKSLAERVVYDALDGIKDKLKVNDPLDVFADVLDKVKPLVEVKSRRVGGATYQVPVDVPEKRGATLAMRWLIDSARGRREKTMSARLTAEIIEAYEDRGTAMKKRDDTHRMAEANKAFAHFRW